MPHNRRLVLSGIALTKARIPPRSNAAAANRVRDELEQEMIQRDYLENAPFSWIGLSIRYGLVDEAEPHYDSIDPADGELPLAIEIDIQRLLDATEDEMAAVYRRATLIALIHVGNKYGLNVDRMKELVAKA